MAFSYSIGVVGQRWKLILNCPNFSFGFFIFNSYLFLSIAYARSQASILLNRLQPPLFNHLNSSTITPIERLATFNF